MAHEHPDNKELIAKKDSEWLKQQGLMEQLKGAGSAQKFFFKKNLPERDSAFTEQKKCSCCIDEGTAHLKIEGALGMAGSGILYPAKNWAERLARVADLYIQLGIEEITSHEGCGAAGLAFKRDCGKEVLGDITPDEYGQKWTKELQDAINKKLAEQGEKKTVAIRHISGKEMARPAEFHNARTVWFDATGKFNPGNLDNKLPKGFLIDYGHEEKLAQNKEEKNYPFTELGVAIDIALGGHGFGDKFTPDDPFTVVVISESAEQARQLQQQIDKIIEPYAGRVAVDMFVKE